MTDFAGTAYQTLGEKELRDTFEVLKQKFRSIDSRHGGAPHAAGGGAVLLDLVDQPDEIDRAAESATTASLSLVPLGGSPRSARKSRMPASIGSAISRYAHGGEVRHGERVGVRAEVAEQVEECVAS